MGGHSSGLFKGTSELKSQKALDELGIDSSEPTSSIWSHVKATQANYPGTEIPRSFNISTRNGMFWTHGNATEHMNEAVTSLTSRIGNSNPRLYAQFILYDYRKALTNATKNGIHYGKLVNSGNWAFVFAKSRSTDIHPIVKHAQFKGLK